MGPLVPKSGFRLQVCVCVEFVKTHGEFREGVRKRFLLLYIAREHTLAFSYYGAHANKRILACSPESPEPLSPPKQSGRDLSPVRNHLEPPASALVKGCGKHLDSEHRYHFLRDYDAIPAGTPTETVSDLCMRCDVGHNNQQTPIPD